MFGDNRDVQAFSGSSVFGFEVVQWVNRRFSVDCVGSRTVMDWESDKALAYSEV